jgi:hypothetical protein
MEGKGDEKCLDNLECKALLGKDRDNCPQLGDMDLDPVRDLDPPWDPPWVADRPKGEEQI